MNAWRIDKARRTATAKTGEGARIAGGRWNSAGLPVVYTSEHLSLAVLEILVHAPNSAARQVARGRSAIVIPDQLLEVVHRKMVPKDFGPLTPLGVTQAIGDDWLQSNRSAALVVPSAIIPLEHNILLNPLHPDFARITWSKFEVIHLDARLWTV